MSTTTDTKCSKCGRWQIKLTYCPHCGNKHSCDGYYDSPKGLEEMANDIEEMLVTVRNIKKNIK